MSTVQDHLALIRAVGPEDDPGQFVTAGAEQAGQSQHLAFAHLKTRSRQPDAGRDIAHDQQWLADARSPHERGNAKHPGSE